MRWPTARSASRPATSPLGLGELTGESQGPLLVLGLGNPGPNYELQRHNAGARVVALLARRLGGHLRSGRTASWTARVRSGGREVVLARPRTFMNESGVAGARLTAELRLSLDHVLVVYDDLDLKVGRLRLRRAGSPGGHNGIRSLQAHWHSQEFARVRIGIGRPPEGVDAVEYVLGQPEGEEAALLNEACERAADAVLAVAERGFESAMAEFNRDPRRTDGS